MVETNEAKMPSSSSAPFFTNFSQRVCGGGSAAFNCRRLARTRSSGDSELRAALAVSMNSAALASVLPVCPWMKKHAHHLSAFLVTHQADQFLSANTPPFLLSARQSSNALAIHT